MRLVLNSLFSSSGQSPGSLGSLGITGSPDLPGSVGFPGSPVSLCLPGSTGLLGSPGGLPSTLDLLFPPGSVCPVLLVYVCMHGSPGYRC